jgi:hypothetical protein
MKKKESIVIFEDWFRYARCLSDAEFREFMSAILNYYKTQEYPKFTGLLKEVWDDIIDDLENNVSKRQAKRDTMLRNSKSNPKLNPVPDIRTDIGPDIKSSIRPNTVFDTAGMVDGRLDMVDDKMEDNKMEDGIMEDINDDVIIDYINKGYSFEKLKQMFPKSSSLFDLYLEYK